MKVKSFVMLVSFLVLQSCADNSDTTAIRFSFNGAELWNGATHSLGSTIAGTPIFSDLKLENTGNVPLVQGSNFFISCLNGARFSASLVGGPGVPPGGSAILRVVFDSPTAGAFDDTLRIMHGAELYQLVLAASAFPPI